MKDIDKENIIIKKMFLNNKIDKEIAKEIGISEDCVRHRRYTLGLKKKDFFKEKQKINIEKRSALIGKKFGKLVLIEVYYNKEKKRMFAHCLCDCGNYTDTTLDCLTRGITKSCGCLLSQHGKDMVYNKIDRNVSWKRRIENNNKPKNNTSGVIGVSYNRFIGYWTAHIGINGKRISKNFLDKIEAIKYRKYLEDKYFPTKIWELERIINNNNYK